jgi:DNA repair photolyase
MRLRAIRALADAGVPVGVSIAPLIMGLNDHEMPAVLEAAKSSGASFATYSLVRLPGSVAQVFDHWLAEHVSETQRQTILSRIRETHDGHLNEQRPGLRMKGSGERADQLAQLFRVYAEKVGLGARRYELSSAHFRRPGLEQLELF